MAPRASYATLAGLIKYPSCSIPLLILNVLQFYCFTFYFNLTIRSSSRLPGTLLLLPSPALQFWLQQGTHIFYLPILKGGALLHSRPTRSYSLCGFLGTSQFHLILVLVFILFYLASLVALPPTTFSHCLSNEHLCLDILYFQVSRSSASKPRTFQKNENEGFDCIFQNIDLKENYDDVQHFQQIQFNIYIFQPYVTVIVGHHVNTFHHVSFIPSMNVSKK